MTPTSRIFDSNEPRKSSMNEETVCFQFALLTMRLTIIGVLFILILITALYANAVYFDRERAVAELHNCLGVFFADARLPYWLEDGALLGAVRIETFIIWDTDIDFSVLPSRELNTKEKVLLAAEAACGLEQAPHNERHRVRLCNDRVCALIHFYATNSAGAMRNGEDVITPNSAAAGNEDEEALPRTLIDGKGRIISTDVVFPLQPCWVGSVAASCPNDPSVLLEQSFGANWSTAKFVSLF